jgi:hypothetical protein
MKDHRLEQRQNNFMKVNFDILNQREQHMLSLRKRDFDDKINKRRFQRKTNETTLGIVQEKLDIPLELKSYSIKNIVSFFYKKSSRTFHRLRPS